MMTCNFILKILLSLLSLAYIKASLIRNPLLLNGTEDLDKWMSVVTSLSGDFQRNLRFSNIYRVLRNGLYDLADEALAGIFLLPHVQETLCQKTGKTCPVDLGRQLDEPIEKYLAGFVDRNDQRLSVERLIHLESKLIQMHQITLKYAHDSNNAYIASILDKLHLESVVPRISTKTLGESAVDLINLFSSIVELAREDAVLRNLLAEDPLNLNLPYDLKNHPGTIHFLILLRLLETIQAFIYQEGVTVAAPIFKIRFGDQRVALSPFSTHLVGILTGKFNLNSLLPLERKLRFILDSIIKRRCSDSCLMKAGREILQEICAHLSRIELSKLIKPYQELPSEKCKVSQFVPLKKLGEGGFGNVYLCRYTPSSKDGINLPPRYVAVKVVKKSDDRSKLHGREVKFLIDNGQASASYLVPCLCTFQTAHYGFIVMEYMPGGNLTTVTGQINKLGLKYESFVRIYIAQVILAISEMHAKGIVHRDVKPQNIFLDRYGRARLADYGLSKNIPAGKKLCDKYGHNYQYYPPEMRYGSRVCYGTEVDWYMLGATIYETLTGKAFPLNRSASFPVIVKTMQDCKISDEAQNLVLSLTQPDSNNRLKDIEAIRSHDWLKDFEWDRVISMTPSQNAQQLANSKYDALPPMQDLGPFEDPIFVDDEQSMDLDLRYTRFGKLPIFQKERNTCCRTLEF